MVKFNCYVFVFVEVVVSIVIDVLRFGVLFVVFIYEVCVNVVLKYYSFVSGCYVIDDEYYSFMGYVKNDEGMVFEIMDFYVDCMMGSMFFYVVFL